MIIKWRQSSVLCRRLLIMYSPFYEYTHLLMWSFVSVFLPHPLLPCRWAEPLLLTELIMSCWHKEEAWSGGMCMADNTARALSSASDSAHTHLDFIQTGSYPQVVPFYIQQVKGHLYCHLIMFQTITAETGDPWSSAQAHMSVIHLMNAVHRLQHNHSSAPDC